MRSARDIRLGLFGAAALAFGAAACGGGGGTECGAGTVEMDGTCVPGDEACGAGATFNEETGECEGRACAEGTTEVDGECVPDGTVICETGTTYNEETGTCELDESGCAAGTVLVDGECVPEDETLTGDVTEPAEPNGVNDGDTPGSFMLPAEGESLVIEGCVSPFEDVNPRDQQLDSDLDAYVFQAGGPTLLDVTVDGVGGLAGGFALFSAEPELSADEWMRFGASLVSDTSRRQVFLPNAGVYVLVLTDSRSLFGSGAVGSDDACYFATVAHVALPSPTAITDSATDAVGDDTLFYSYDPTADDAVVTQELIGSTPATQLGLALLKDGAYHASTVDAREEDPDFQRPVEILTADADDNTEVLLAVEPVFDLSLDTVEGTLTVSERLPDAAAPADGSVTLTHSTEQPALLTFEGAAGDLVRVEMTGPIDDLDVFLFPPSLRALDFFSTTFGLQWISNPCSGPNCQGDAWVRLQETGTQYVKVDNFDADDGADYDVTITRTHVTPTDLALGTTEGGDLTTGGDRDFYLLDASSSGWLDFQVSNFANFTSGLVTVYDGSAQGELDYTHPFFGELPGPSLLELFSGTSDGAPFGQIIAGLPDSLLISVEDSAAHDGDETFDFDVTTADVTDLGSVDSTADVTANDETIPTDGSNFYLVRTTQGERVTFSVTGTGGTDPRIRRLRRNESTIPPVVNDTGADGTEELTFFAPPAGFAAFRVDTPAGAGGDVDITVSAEAPVSGTVDPFPDLDIPDGDPDGVSASFMIADTCTIDVPFVGVEVRHTDTTDLVVTLTSPDGTELTLHDQTDEGTDLVGLYADGGGGDFTPVDPLSGLQGESATGTWTLTVTDQTGDDDVGKLKSFTVATFCQ